MPKEHKNDPEPGILDAVGVDIGTSVLMKDKNGKDFYIAF